MPIPSSSIRIVWGYAHERGAGPGLGANLNIPLPKGTGDDDYIKAIGEAEKTIRAFAPGALVVALGLDASEHDPLAGLAVTTAGFRRIGAAIARLGPSDRFRAGGRLSVRYPRRQSHRCAWRFRRGALAASTLATPLAGVARCPVPKSRHRPRADLGSGRDATKNGPNALSFAGSAGSVLELFPGADGCAARCDQQIGLATSDLRCRRSFRDPVDPHDRSAPRRIASARPCRRRRADRSRSS